MSRTVEHPMALRIIDRYMFKEIVVPTCLGMAVFVFVFMVSKLFRVTEMVVDQGVPLGYALKLFLCLVPAILIFVVPMAFLLGVLLALARLSGDSEVVALKASGISFYRLSPSVALLAALTCVTTAFLVFCGVPWGSKNFRETLLHLAETKAKIEVRERVFNDQFGDLVIYVDKRTGQGNIYEGVMVYDEREEDTRSVIFARTGNLVSDPDNQRVVFYLSDGSIHSQDAGQEVYRTIEFATYRLTVDLKKELAKVRRRGGMRMLEKEMSISDLRRKINRRRSQGATIRPQLVELHFKFAIPFAALVFGLVGMPLGLQRSQSGRSWGFVLSLCVLLLYYVLYTVGKNLATYGVMSPVLAAWSPNILFGALGLYLFVKTANESPLRLLVWMDQILRRVRKRWGRFFQGA
jgi:lipopolysaccharide export system permease protein